MKFAYLFASTGLVLALVACNGGGSSGAGTTPTAVASAPVQTPPIVYFDEKCATCHGFEGSNYGPTFGQNLNEPQLRQVVKDMADGRAQSPLNDKDLDVQVAYHRALILKEPFLAWTSTDGGKLSGDVTPGASLTATADGKSLPVTVTDKKWTIDAGTTDPKSITLTAEAGGKKTVLNLGVNAYSHSTPLS